MVPNNDKDRTYAVSYVPKVAGLHKVSTYRPARPPPPPHPAPPPCTSHPPPTLLGSALLCSSIPSQSCSPLKAYLWPLTPR